MPDDTPEFTPFLGKREPVNRPTIQLGDFLTVQEIPDHPTSSPPPNVRWTMDRNDQAGDCVVAGVNHTLQAIATNLGLPRQPWDDSQILELYRTQNPDFHSWSDGGSDADQGMVIQTFLEECIQRGHISGFARIDHENHELMRAATYVGGGIVTGEMLRQAHSNLDLWDASRSAMWGGHCTTTVGYNADQKRFACVTWGQVTPYTEAFAEKHLDEAWFILTPAMINNPGFRNNFDMAGFADAVADLTNGKIIVPVPAPVPNQPPTAPPGDNPPPTPADPAWDDFPFGEMERWSHKDLKGDTRQERTAKRAYRQWAANHNVAARNAATRRVVYDENGQRIGEIELGSGSFWASQS